ncbi:360_t:CDS:2 [Ambispora gerdemannii]|uniref:360_t:CDS:1 n=1 Tax=Ambispora gerdemannii TaxID=144530 RepID=A0A9N9CF10_9GLOM|nr:360_t:CDS:2 [Ambispora gerdemannii]
MATTFSGIENSFGIRGVSSQSSKDAQPTIGNRSCKLESYKGGSTSWMVE